MKVLPVNAYGKRPPLDSCTSAFFDPPKDKTPPGKPLFFAGQVDGRHIMFTWLPPEDPDIGGYILKWSASLTGATWSKGSLERDMIPHDALSTTVNVRTGTYMLKTIDTSGNLSTDFAVVRTTIPDLDGLDLFELVQEDPAFSGIHYQTEVHNQALRLKSKTTTPPCELYDYGIYLFNRITDVGAIYDVHLSANLQIDGDACDPVVMADWVPNLAAVRVLQPPATGEIDAIVQVRTATHLSIVMADWVPNLSAPIADPLAPQGIQSDWSGWMNLTAGVFSGRYFQFRLVLATRNESMTPVVYRARVKVDMPERRVAEHDLPTVVGGSRVLFPGGAFFKPPAVATTLDNASSGEWLKVSNIGVDGFDVEVFSGAGASIVRQFDYVAVGYGQLLPAMLVTVDGTEDDDPALFPDAMKLARSPVYYN